MMINKYDSYIVESSTKGWRRRLSKLGSILLEDSPGKRVLLLGNEAIARGVFEAGIGVVTTYPGTPASEIGDSVSLVAREAGIYMEYSVNEKVAVETAAGAAISGVRALSAMKHVGVNVAADALMTLAYVGVRAGYVIVTADDPNCYSSQNEQDNRYYALLSSLPMLEPSNSQEAKDMVVHSIEISEMLELPCLLRTTTRVSHTRNPVTLGKLQKARVKGEFERNPRRFVMVPANARIQHKILLEKVKKAKEISEKSIYNQILREGKEIGIITSGVSYNYVIEAVDALNLEAGILKLGMSHPLPEMKISDFLKKYQKIVVVEELEPYLELHVRAFAKNHAPETEIYGRMNTDLFPKFGEFSTRLVVEALAKITKKKVPVEFEEIDKKFAETSKLLLPRPPVLCPGCPHRASFYVIKRATGGKAVHPTDIGCYALGIQPPLKIGDVLICMGASAGTACGISKVIEEPVVAVVGDSTFFHAAIPALVNAVYNKHRIVLVVLDNLTTAMTGHQPHPGTGLTGLGVSGKRVLVEDIARGCGVEYVGVVDPFKVREAIDVLKKALMHDGPAVVVFRSPCALLVTAEKRRRGEKIVSARVVAEKCTDCLACVKLLGCPALVVEDGRVVINDALCVGCMLCASVCPYDAIKLEVE